jgi:hypothetical protein
MRTPTNPTQVMTTGKRVSPAARRAAVKMIHAATAGMANAISRRASSAIPATRGLSGLIHPHIGPARVKNTTPIAVITPPAMPNAAHPPRAARSGRRCPRL